MLGSGALLGVEPERVGLRLHRALALLLCEPSHSKEAEPREPCYLCMETVRPLVKPVARAICSAAGYNHRKERPKFLPPAGQAVEELSLDAVFSYDGKTRRE